jgi:hypothetical protein
MKEFISSVKTCIPSFNGNRELPEAEQVVVTYKIPDLELKGRLKPPSKLKFNFDPDGRASGGETEVSVNKFGVVSGMLLSIKHLSYEDEKGEHSITKWNELLHGPLQYEPLIGELYDEFSKELDKVVDEKN